MSTTRSSTEEAVALAPNTRTHQSQPMSKIKTPHDNDVLCGRGIQTDQHLGNQRFRALVMSKKELYVVSTKKEKMKISQLVVRAIREGLEPPGRFITKDPSTSLWFDVGFKRSVEKTSQALRDAAADLRKMLSTDLAALGRLRRKQSKKKLGVKRKVESTNFPPAVQPPGLSRVESTNVQERDGAFSLTVEQGIPPSFAGITDCGQHYLERTSLPEALADNNLTSESYLFNCGVQEETDDWFPDLENILPEGDGDCQSPLSTEDIDILQEILGTKKTGEHARDFHVNSFMENNFLAFDTDLFTTSEENMMFGKKYEKNLATGV